MSAIVRLLGLHPVVVEQHAQVGIVVRPRSEQVVPGAVEPSAIAAIDDVAGEEVVGALVLDRGDERVVLRAVVGVVEGRRHGVLVGRVGSPCELGGISSRYSAMPARKRAVAVRSPGRRGTRAARRARRSGRRSATITRTTAWRSRPELGVDVKLGDVLAGTARRSRTRSSSWSAKSSGPSAVPSGLVPKPSRAATSAGEHRASERVSTDRAAARAARVTASRLVGRRRRGSVRSTMRGLRQMTAGAPPGPRCSASTDRCTFQGAGMLGAPRPNRRFSR